MPMSTPVKLTSDLDVVGSGPVILIGPNGSGKTRLGTKMVGLNKADMVPALRNIALPPEVRLRTLTAATRELQNSVHQQRQSPWQISDEIQWLFSKLMVEDSDSAVRFRDRYSPNQMSSIEITSLMRLRLSWDRLFPGRSISFESHKLTVVSDYSPDDAGYAAQQMSDGERVALYLAGRVLDTSSSVLIVDEPEVHFHSKLTIRFWSEMEILRQDVKFVYITHDLQFALSRNNARFVIIMPNKSPQIVDVKDSLPQELIEVMLAAASFSIYAKRIVFCEGEENKSIDWNLYSSWFQEKETIVIPVGSGKEVVQCVKAFTKSVFISGVVAVGIIDRDYWPKEFIEAQPAEVVVLPYHELESLLCREEVFRAIAAYLGRSESQIGAHYQEFVARAKAKCAGGFLNKQISERFRRRCEFATEAALNGLRLDEDIEALEQQHIAALDPSVWAVPAAAIFREERERFEHALGGSFEECLKLLPGKEFLRLAAGAVGMERDAYVELICSALSSSEDNLRGLGNELEMHLSDILPARQVGES